MSGFSRNRSKAELRFDLLRAKKSRLDIPYGSRQDISKNAILLQRRYTSSTPPPPSDIIKLYRSITEPIREDANWEIRWNAEDGGLIACWERGREKRCEDPSLAARAAEGQLVVLPWKGGVEKVIKRNRSLARCSILLCGRVFEAEDLDIDTAEEVALNCAANGMTVVFTADMAKYAEA